MNIGQVADASGVSAKMIRYYESIALVPPAARKESGYRSYTDEDVSSLRFIKRARTLGFSIERIGLLMGLWRDKRRESSDVKRIALAHVAELQAKIVELVEMRETHQELAASCHASYLPACRILRNP